MKLLNSKPTLMALIALSFFLTACDFKKSDPITLLDKVNPGANQGQGNGNGDTGNNPDVRPEDQLITFAHLQKTALVSCKTCHARTNNEARKPLLLTAAQYQGRIQDVIDETSSGSMPPEDDGYKPLTACEQAMLEKWVELGAPEATNVKVYDLAACNPNPPVVNPPPVEPPPVVEPPVVNPPPTEPPVSEDELLTFATLQKTALVSCKDCHSTTKNPAKKPLLKTPDDYKARMSDVLHEINEDSMPPTEDDDTYKVLTACEKAMVQKWADLGTPERSDFKIADLEACRPAQPPPVIEPPVVEPPPPVVEEPVVTFDHLLKTSLVSCKDCHSKTTNEKKKPLLLTAEQYKGRIADVVMTVDEDEMPITKNGAKLLSACEKAMLHKWVDAGAPEKTTVKISDIAECKSETAQPVPAPVDLQPVINPLNLIPSETQTNEAPNGEEESLLTFDHLLKTSFVSCKDCHSKTKNEKKKPLLTNLEQYQGRLADVQHAVNKDDMPSTDNGASLLNSCEKAMMNAWVGAGAPAVTAIKLSEISECKHN